MNITFTAKQMEKPEHMSVKAQMAWDYLGFGSGGWCCAMVDDNAVIVTDESGDLTQNGTIFLNLPDFVSWLEDVFNDNMSGDPRTFLSGSGWVKESLLTDEVITAIKNKIGLKTGKPVNWYMAVYDGDYENRYSQFTSDKEAIENFLTGASRFSLLEIYRCKDSECLSPDELIWH